MAPRCKGAILVMAMASCAPELDLAPYLITEARIVAVRAEPAEAAPGERVRYQGLVVDPGGLVAGATIDWAYCPEPRPLAEPNTVAAACVTAALTPLGPPGPSVEAAVPDDACARFGPETPPGAEGETLRPRDPDSTGGYYQPVRARHRGEVSFGAQRLLCDLASAPAQLAVQWRSRYLPNRSPEVAGLELADGAPLPQRVAPSTVLSLSTRWAAEAAEVYLTYDLERGALVERREALRVSWLVTAGTLRSFRTGRESDDLAIDSANEWTAPDSTGTVHLFVVLRDDRGGVSWREAAIEVGP